MSITHIVVLSVVGLWLSAIVIIAIGVIMENIRLYYRRKG